MEILIAISIKKSWTSQDLDYTFVSRLRPRLFVTAAPENDDLGPENYVTAISNAVVYSVTRR